MLAATAVSFAQEAKPAVEVSLERRAKEGWQAVYNTSVFPAAELR